ncbi:hypothetical protein TNCV_2237611 [Trichonephila clavipes]|nr:hypothetical protein TNCV_2237611 [Trichonephila clavipes]
MVWARIRIGGRTHLHIILNSDLTSQRNSDEILRDSMLCLILQPLDNARLYTNLLVKNFIESETIPLMGWIACSTDLIPIERVWDTLGRHIAARSRFPVTGRIVRIGLRQEWNSNYSPKSH